MKHLQQTPVERYQSLLTGAEIDSRLMSISDKVSSSELELSMDGGAGSKTTGVSAYAIQALKSYVDERFKIFTGDSSIDLVPFTQDLFDQYNRNNWYFQGIYANAGFRDVAIVPGVDTLHFTGVEMCILEDNGSGQKVIQRWNSTLFIWEDFIIGLEKPITTTITIPGTFPIGTFSFPTFKAVRFFVSGLSSGGIMQAVDCVVIYDGSDSYISSFGEISTNNTPWFSVEAIGGAIVTVSVTATSTGVINARQFVSL